MVTRVINQNDIHRQDARGARKGDTGMIPMFGAPGVLAVNIILIDDVGNHSFSAGR